MDKEDIVQKMFGVFGRKPMQVQFDTYMEQLDEYTTDTVEKLYMHMVNNCERMPSLFEIKRIVRDHGWGKANRISADFDLTCLKCDSTGFIPFINRPKGVTLRYYLTTYRCDCSYGKEMSESIPAYYKVHKELQFTNLEDGMSYGAYVSRKCTEFNKELNKRDDGKVETVGFQQQEKDQN